MEWNAIEADEVARTSGMSVCQIPQSDIFHIICSKAEAHPVPEAEVALTSFSLNLILLVFYGAAAGKQNLGVAYQSWKFKSDLVQLRHTGSQ